MRKSTVLHIALVAALATFMSTVESKAAPTIFFGQDLNAGSAANIPNSLGARTAFLAALSGFGLEPGLQNFESFSVPIPNATSLTFDGTSVTATITGGRISDQATDAVPGGSGRFPISGNNYYSSGQNRQITFSTPVSAFATFVTDWGEADNPESIVTPEELLARPFDTVDGIFRLVTERSPGVFESFGPIHTFPAGGDGAALFIGVIDTLIPLTNVFLINGTSGLVVGNDGFGFDDFFVATPSQVSVPAPTTLILLGAGLAALAAVAWKQGLEVVLVRSLTRSARWRARFHPSL
jgi:hypothetical protein